MSNFYLQKTPLGVLLDLAEKIKQHRKSEKYSQKELAERSGVSLGSLKRFENTGQISLESLVKLANIFGRLEDFDELFKPKEDFNSLKKLFSK